MKALKKMVQLTEQGKKKSTNGTLLPSLHETVELIVQNAMNYADFVSSIIDILTSHNTVFFLSLEHVPSTQENNGIFVDKKTHYLTPKLKEIFNE
jgi:hypothetical protein